MKQYSTAEMEKTLDYLAQVINAHGEQYLPLFQVVNDALQIRKKKDDLMHIVKNRMPKNGAQNDAHFDTQNF